MQVDNLSLTMHQGWNLVKNLSFHLNKGDRLAIIGDEGNGKSTLIKAIYEPSLIEDYCLLEGNINRFNQRIGYLPQFLDEKYLKMTVYDFLTGTIQKRQEYEKLGDVFEQLSILNLDPKIIDNNQKMETLSGGEKIKVQLAKLLVEEYDILLLDEPSNDIDLETLIYLENFIINAPCSIIFISHDETLLKKCATRILHLRMLKKRSKSNYRLENMGYEEYVLNFEKQYVNQLNKAIYERKVKKEKEEVLRKLHSKVEHQLNQAVRNPTQGRLLAKKMKVITGQEKKLEKQELTEIPLLEEAINVSFSDENIGVHSSFRVLELNDYTLKIDNKILASNINLTIIGNQKVGFIGKNGVGKTTLLRVIKDEISSKDLKVGYLPQNYLEELDPSLTCVEYLQSNTGYDKENLTRIMNYLGALNFKSEEMLSKITYLSGGQKCKLCLVRILLENNDVLLLDEPTRNLSPLSLPQIRNLFASFNGVIIAISHDRMFLKEVMDIIYELKSDGLIEVNKESLN